jgi:hypothetical protein
MFTAKMSSPHARQNGRSRASKDAVSDSAIKSGICTTCVRMRHSNDALQKKELLKARDQWTKTSIDF